MILRSEVDFSDLEWTEVAKYLKIIYSDEELEEEGVLNYLPIRNATTGRKPTTRYLSSDIIKRKRKTTISEDSEDTQTSQTQSRRPAQRTSSPSPSRNAKNLSWSFSPVRLSSNLTSGPVKRKVRWHESVRGGEESVASPPTLIPSENQSEK